MTCSELRTGGLAAAASAIARWTRVAAAAVALFR
jgi:hypothetical protein